MDKINRNIYLNKIIKFMKNDYPIFHKLEEYGFHDKLSKKEMNYVLSEIFGEPVKKKGDSIYNQNDNMIYIEYPYGKWIKYEYDNNENMIYWEDSNGYWEKI